MSRLSRKTHRFVFLVLGAVGLFAAACDTAPRVVGLDARALPLDPPAGAKFRTAILAFDLSANGIKLDAPLDVEKAKSLEIPRKK